MNSDLMQAVLASADDDDDARLVYADWCEDEGDLDRATFIRTQIERARLPRWDVRQIALRNVEEKLIAVHGKTWLGEAPSLDGITWTGFERGFVAHAEVESFGALATARDALVKSTPLHRVLVPWPQSDPEAREAATIPTLRAMRIQQEVMEDAEEPRWLAASPMLAGVVELELVDGWAADPGTRTILESPHLRGLRRLELVRNEIGREAVHALAEGDFPNLIELKLEERGEEDGSWSQWEGGLDEESMAVFSAWPGLARLKRLDLSYNRIPEDGFVSFFESPHLTALEALRLEFAFTHVGQMPWGIAKHLRLKELGLSHHQFYDYRDDERAPSFHEAPCVRELQRLTLRNAVFRWPAHIQSVLGAFADTLEALDFRSVDMDVWPKEPDDSAVRALLATTLPRLNTLCVGSLYDALSPAAVEWADTEEMRWLRVASKEWGAVAKALASARFPNLERLELEGIPKRDRRVVLDSPLGKRLSETRGLRFLPGRG